MIRKEDDLGYIIITAGRLFKWEMKNRISGYGLTYSQGLVIMNMYEQLIKQGELFTDTPAAISLRLGFDRPTVSGIIERLIKHNLVNADVNPSDRRSLMLTLTDKAKELMSLTDPIKEEIMNKAIKGFTLQEHKELMGYLTRVINNLHENSEELKCCFEELEKIK